MGLSCLQSPWDGIRIRVNITLLMWLCRFGVQTRVQLCRAVGAQLPPIKSLKARGSQLGSSSIPGCFLGKGVLAEWGCGSCACLAQIFCRAQRETIKGSSTLRLKIAGAQDGAGAAGGGNTEPPSPANTCSCGKSCSSTKPCSVCTTVLPECKTSAFEGTSGSSEFKHGCLWGQCPSPTLNVPAGQSWVAAN